MNGPRWDGTRIVVIDKSYPKAIERWKTPKKEPELLQTLRMAPRPAKPETPVKDVPISRPEHVKKYWEINLIR
jgi:hypothetical protein